MMLNKTKLGMAVLTALLLTTGCEQKQTAEQHLAEAKSYVTKKENSKAIIELKNALSKEQNLDEARLLLGQLYLQNGEFLAAEIEFNKLYNSDYPASKLLVNLAKARYLQQELESIPDLWESRDVLSSAQAAQLGFYTYIALKQSDNVNEVKQLKSELIPSKQDQTYTKLIIAYEQAEQEQIEQALSTIENILLAEPQNIEALLFKGQLHSFKKEYEDAVSAFQAFLDIMPNYVLTKLYLADTLFKSKEFEEATKLVDELIMKSPNFGYFNYLKGMLLFTENNFDESKLFLEKAIQSQTNIQQSKLYAGLSAFRTENYEQAYEYLTEVIDEVPNNDELRRILSVVQFNLGYNVEASDSIARLSELSERDLNLANRASLNFIRAGENEKAKQLLEQASKLNSDNAEEIAKLGMLKVSMQDMSGIVDIKKAIEIDSNMNQAKVALVQAYMGQGLEKDALDIAEKWISEEPNNKNGYNLASFVAIGMRELPLAEQYLNKALELDSGNIPSLMFFAGKAHSENDLETATKFLKQLVKHKPNYVPGLVNNFLLSKQQGKADEGLALMELAYNNSSNNQPLKLAFIRALYTEKKYEKAKVLLKEYELSERTPEFILMLLVDLELKAENMEQARKYSKIWVKAKPRSEKAWASAVQLVDYSKPNEAINLIEQAHNAFPNSEPLTLLFAERSLVMGDFEKARDLVNSVSLVNENVTFLSSQIALKEGNFEFVIDNYSGDKKLNAKQALLLVRAFRLKKDKKMAANIAKEYAAVYPENFSLLFEVATLTPDDNELGKEQLYRQILNLKPKHVPSLNNLALLLLKRGSTEEGSELAKKAFRLAPNYLPVIDTMAASFTSQKKFKEASNIYQKLYLQTKDEQFFGKYIKQLLGLKDTTAAERQVNLHKSKISEGLYLELKSIIDSEVKGV